MRQAYSERFYLNRVGEDAPQTVRLTLRMTDAVDGRMLSEAVTRLHPADGDGVPTVVVAVNITGRHPMEIASIADYNES